MSGNSLMEQIFPVFHQKRTWWGHAYGLTLTPRDLADRGLSTSITPIKPLHLTHADPLEIKVTILNVPQHR